MGTDTLAFIADALARQQSGPLRSDALVHEVRAQLASGGLPPALPPRYAEVLDQLLDRLESSALFSEESCSFSQRDLIDALGQWLTRARAATDGAKAPSATGPVR